jgi:hypothetical protein
MSTAHKVRKALASDLQHDGNGKLDTSWVMKCPWSGPQKVPASRIDMRDGDTSWAAARDDAKRLRQELPMVRSGKYDPVILVRIPGESRLWCVNGHTRIIISQQLGKPVNAWIGTVPSAQGPWTAKRRSSHASANS